MSEAASVDHKASLTRLALFALFLLVARPAVAGEVALTSTQVPFGYDVLPNVTYVRRPGGEGKLILFVPSDRTSATAGGELDVHTIWCWEFSPVHPATLIPNVIPPIRQGLF